MLFPEAKEVLDLKHVQPRNSKPVRMDDLAQSPPTQPGGAKWTPESGFRRVPAVSRRTAYFRRVPRPVRTRTSNRTPRTEPINPGTRRKPGNPPKVGNWNSDLVFLIFTASLGMRRASFPMRALIGNVARHIPNESSHWECGAPHSQ